MRENRRQATAKANARRTRVLRWRLSAVGVLVALAGLGIWHHLSSRLPCDPGLKRFRAALERRDFDDLYAMTTDIEKQQLGVTKAMVERAFRETVFGLAPRVRTRFARIDTPAQVTDRWAWRTLAILDARTGRSLPTFHPSGEYICVVRLYKQKDGEWHVVMADVVRGMLFANHYRRKDGDYDSPAGIKRRREISRTVLGWGFRGTLAEPESMQVAGQWISTGEPPVHLYKLAGQ